MTISDELPVGTRLRHRTGLTVTIVEHVDRQGGYWRTDNAGVPVADGLIGTYWSILPSDEPPADDVEKARTQIMAEMARPTARTIETLKRLRESLCNYGARTDQTCDCKYSDGVHRLFGASENIRTFPYYGEHNGCPELRTVIAYLETTL